MRGLPTAFWWLWITTLINRVGGFVSVFLMLYLTLDRGFTASTAGLVIALCGLGGTAGNLLGGVLTDRVGRRPVLMGAQLLNAATTLLLGFVEPKAAIVVVAFFACLTANASKPAMMAIVADIIPEQDRGRAFSLNFWAINIGFGVGATVAGLAAEWDYLVLFVAEAVATVICGVVVYWKVPETRPVALPAEEGTAAPARIGIFRVLADGRFVALLCTTAALCLLYQQASTTLPVTMARTGLTPAQFGLVIGVNGLLVVVLQIPVTRIVATANRSVLLALASLLSGWGFGLVVFAHTTWFYAVTVAVWTVGECVLAPVAVEMATRFAPDTARGRYLGLYSIATSSLPAMVGPALGGLLLDRLGADPFWLGCGLVGTVAAVAYVLLTRTPAGAPQAEPAPALSGSPVPD
ncbi:MFS transporter [Dactylosporangium sp. NPDC050688]|uniref:MDR family MFS transporter n=1 Tax=Dactylosporangium sp. NPDC050688 TaxID=3157217 RepID=UPI0033CD4E6A